MQNQLEIGNTIAARRKKLGLSQTELAEYARCSRPFISEIERGKTSVQFDKLLSVLQVLGLKIDIREHNV